MPRSTRLRTIQDVYHQIRWDSRLAGRAFALIVEDRPSGLKEIPFGAFVPDGEIPWHRVLRILLDGALVWGREERVDRLDALASAGSSAAAAPAPAPARVQDPPGELRGLRPEAPRQAAEFRDATLRVATLNVLCDAFDAELIDTPTRLPVLARELAQCGADLLGLSEVTPALWALLREQPWARGAYFFSDGEGASVRPHGQLLLSRWPISAASFLPLTPTRRVLCCDVQHPAGAIRVLVLHLVSNATPDAERLRREELRRALALLDGHPRAVVMGDFNLGEDEARDLLAGASLEDPWHVLFPEDPGFTYDPGRNALASLFSRDGRPRRYDRVLTRGLAAPCGASLFATEPIQGAAKGLFPSDHFGVLVDLRGASPGSLEHAAPTYHTALALVPPPSCWPVIEALRAAHDKGFLRWPPHATLIYGFAPEECFPEALALTAAVCRGVAPFPVQLAAAGRFDHGGSSTVWLDPGSNGALPALQAALQRAFPRFSEQGDRGFTPHLTVARFSRARREDALAFERALRASFSPISFEAGEVHLLARRADLPFASVARVQLGTGKILPGFGPRGELDPWEAPRSLAPRAPSARREAVLERLRATLAREVPSSGLASPWVEPLGSAVYYPDLPDSDLDLLLLCPRGLPARQALRWLHEALLREGATGRLVLEAAHPAVRAKIDGLAVDITAAELRVDVPPGPVVALPPRAFDGLPETERAALLGVLDAHALRLLVAPLQPRWGWLLRVVRRWTEARALQGQWAGFPGGMSWAILAARYCMDNPCKEGSALLDGFFSWCAAHPWPEPVALGPVTPGEERGCLPILAPAAPPRDTARSVSEGSRRVLLEELRRASAVVRGVRQHQGASSELFEEAQASGKIHRIVLPGGADEEARGAAQASVLGVVRTLETEGHRVRVYARWRATSEGETLELGLDEQTATQAPQKNQRKRR